MSSSATCAIRRSRKLPAAFSTAAAAAFSQDSVLVPTNSMTLYTLSATTGPPRRRCTTLLARRARVNRHSSGAVTAACKLRHNVGCEGAGSLGRLRWHVGGRGLQWRIVVCSLAGDGVFDNDDDPRPDQGADRQDRPSRRADAG